MDTLPILLDNQPMGSLRVEQEGLYALFQAVCPLWAEEPLRLAAVGETGEVRLGVPEPQNGKLILRRRVSLREVQAAGTLLRGELRRCREESREAWLPVEQLAPLFRSSFLKEQLRDISGGRTCQVGGLRFVALPYDGRRPFLLTSLFCFARIGTIDGKRYAVFCFDRDENPVFREPPL